MKDIILSLSGGLDSSSLLFEFKERIALAVSFKYPSNHNSIEIKHAKIVAKKAKVPHKVIDLTKAFKDFKSALLSGANAVPNAEYNKDSITALVVPFRNGIFLSVLAGLAESMNLKYIALASHSGDHCFTKDTKFFTPEGIKELRKLKINDSIYSFNKDTKKIENDKITNIIKAGTNNKILEIQSAAGILKVTEEHKVYKLKLGDFDRSHGYNKNIELIPAKDLREGDYVLSPANFVKEDELPEKLDIIPIVEHIKKKHNIDFKVFCEDEKVWINAPSYKELAIPQYVNIESFVSLLAWYITEGYSWKTGFEGDNSKGGKYSAQFCQSLNANLENVDLIDNLIKDNNLKVKRQFSKVLSFGIPKEVTYYCSNILSVFMKDCGGHSYQKHIPDWLMDILISSKKVRESFLSNMILGDGCKGRFNDLYISKSEKLLEQVSYLASISGNHYIYGLKRWIKDGANTIALGRKGRKEGLVMVGNVKFSKITKITPLIGEQDVYDITVEKNHNFFAGIKGFQLISNSVYPDCRPEFTNAMKEAIKLGTSNNIEFFAPYVNITKAQIAYRGIRNGLNVFDTYSCYKGGKEPCGVCPTCIERDEAIASAFAELANARV